MSPTAINSAASAHRHLGALVRERRERMGLSMNQLAERSRVSRSSIHRLEHGHEIRPTPSKLARVLAVVELGPDDVRATMPDDQYRAELLHWMAATPPAATVLDALEGIKQAPDLVAIHHDGTVAEVRTNSDNEARVEELADALKRAGWLVTRPT